MKRVLIPLPDNGFDPTEAVLPWRECRTHGIEVVFATPDGAIAHADPRLLTGVIGPWGRADKVARDGYVQMIASDEFQHPMTYAAVDVSSFDALFLPGGHAPQMKVYLESTQLRDKVLQFFTQGKLISAICHGPIVLARTIDPSTGKSVIAGRKLTALPKWMERTAYYLSAWKLGRYYRTYPEYAGDEVMRASEGSYLSGPVSLAPFVVEDGNLLTGRWPGDAGLLAERIVRRLS